MTKCTGIDLFGYRLKKQQHIDIKQQSFVTLKKSKALLFVNLFMEINFVFDSRVV